MWMPRFFGRHHQSLQELPGPSKLNVSSGNIKIINAAKIFCCNEIIHYLLSYTAGPHLTSWIGSWTLRKTTVNEINYFFVLFYICSYQCYNYIITI